MWIIFQIHLKLAIAKDHNVGRQNFEVPEIDGFGRALCTYHTFMNEMEVAPNANNSFPPLEELG